MPVRSDGKYSMYICSARAGGALNALDALTIVGIGGPNTYDLITGDTALIFADEGLYAYKYDGAGVEEESDPDIIRPDDYQTAGNWVMVDLAGTFSGYTEASQAEMEAGSVSDARAMSPVGIFQAVAGYLKSRYGHVTPLTAEPANEWVGQIALADNSTWDPSGVGGTIPYYCVCTAVGSPGTWRAFLSADGTLLTSRIPIFTATYAATGSISADDMYNRQLNNYGQAADAVLTLPAAAAGMNMIFEIVDTSNALTIRPPASGQLRFVDSAGAMELLAANEGVTCSAANMAVGEELRVTTYQTGASTYGYKVVQTIGDGFAEETP